MKIDFDNAGVYEQEDLIGYDPDTSGFKVFGVTNTGSPHYFTGSWDNEQTILLERSGVQYGSVYTDNLKIDLIDENSFSISECHKVAEKEVLTAYLSLTRTF
jgi:hypothetical protein